MVIVLTISKRTTAANHLRPTLSYVS